MSKVTGDGFDTSIVANVKIKKADEIKWEYMHPVEQIFLQTALTWPAVGIGGEVSLNATKPGFTGLKLFLVPGGAEVHFKDEKCFIPATNMICAAYKAKKTK